MREKRGAEYDRLTIKRDGAVLHDYHYSREERLKMKAVLPPEEKRNRARRKVMVTWLYVILGLAIVAFIVVLLYKYFF